MMRFASVNYSCQIGVVYAVVGVEDECPGYDVKDKDKGLKVTGKLVVGPVSFLQ